MAPKFKDFLNNTAFTADEGDEYFMRQVIIACNNAADRNSIPSPQEGMTVYRKDLDVYETYDGSDWVNKTTQKFKVGSFTSNGSTGNRSITGVGFKPKLVKFQVVVTAGVASQAMINNGVMDESGGQWSAAFAARGSPLNTITNAPSTSSCLRNYGVSAGGVGAVDVMASYVSMDSDGFTINFSATSAGYTILWEAYG